MHDSLPMAGSLARGGQVDDAALIPVLVVLTFVIIKLVPRIGHPAWAVAIGLLCAGVAGNLTDRLFRAPGPLRGHVIDFLELPHWPIFNVADMCITAAAIMIIFLSIVKGISITGQRHRRGGGAGDDGDHDRSTVARG